MEYKPSDFAQTIPSRTTVVPSDHQLEYTAGQTIRFDIEKFISFIDPRSTCLKFTMSATGEVPMSLPRHSGAQSVIQSLRLYDGPQVTQLEALTDYNRRVELMSAYSENPSVLAKRQLLEGVPTDRSSVSALSQAQFNAASFSNGYTTTEIVITESESNPDSIEVCMPLWSGVLGVGADTAGGGKVYPNLLTGLHLELDLAQPEEILKCHSSAGLARGYVAATQQQAGGVVFEIDSFVGGTDLGDPVTQILLKAQNLVPTALSGGPITPYPSTHALLYPPNLLQGVYESQLVQNGTTGMGNFKINSHVQITAPTSLGDLTPVVHYCGTITSISPVDYNTTLPTINVTVVGGYNPAAAAQAVLAADGNGNGLFALCDGWNVGAVNASQMGCVDIPAPVLAAPLVKPSYTLSNVELLVKSCQPPKQYVDALVRQSQSKDGYSLDILTYETNRNNVNAVESVSQIVIPTFVERATAVMSLPYAPIQYANPYLYEPLTPVMDSVKSYVWVISNQTQPTIPVDTKRRLYGKYAQLWQWENEKALTACRLPVRNLDLLATDDGGTNHYAYVTNTSKGAMYARCLAKYGGVWDARADGSVQLRTEFFNPQVNKLFVTFLAHLRRINVSSEGVNVAA